MIAHMTTESERKTFSYFVGPKDRSRVHTVMLFEWQFLATASRHLRKTSHTAMHCVKRDQPSGMSAIYSIHDALGLCPSIPLKDTGLTSMTSKPENDIRLPGFQELFAGTRRAHRPCRRHSRRPLGYLAHNTQAHGQPKGATARHAPPRLTYPVRMQ